MVSIKFPKETQSITSLDTTNHITVDVTACNKTLIDEVKATYGDVPNVEIIAPKEQLTFDFEYENYDGSINHSDNYISVNSDV